MYSYVEFYLFNVVTVIFQTINYLLAKLRPIDDAGLRALYGLGVGVSRVHL